MPSPLPSPRPPVFEPSGYALSSPHPLHSPRPGLPVARYQGSPSKVMNHSSPTDEPFIAHSNSCRNVHFYFLPPYPCSSLSSPLPLSCITPLNNNLNHDKLTLTLSPTLTEAGPPDPLG